MSTGFIYVGSALATAWLFQLINPVALANPDMLWFGLLMAVAGAWMRGWYGFGKKD